jgi:hypothetical protein
MNTVGKILVILNFLFAIVVGAFLVVDFVARANWKKAYEERERYLQVVNADRDTHADDASKYRGDNKDLVLQLEKLKGDLLDQELKAKAEVANLEIKVSDANTKAKDADLSLQKAIADIERLKISESDLKKIIKEREGAILGLQDEVKKYRTEAISNEQLAKQVSDRNQELLEQVTKLGVELAKAKAGTSGDGPSITARYGDAPNPPSTMVKGKVERVDGALIQISLGTDHGVNKGNTMEVFRTSPAAKYLGMVRIMDSSPRQSVGRMIVPAGATQPVLLEGDNVWSRLK